MIQENLIMMTACTADPENKVYGAWCMDYELWSYKMRHTVGSINYLTADKDRVRIQYMIGLMGDRFILIRL